MTLTAHDPAAQQLISMLWAHDSGLPLAGRLADHTQPLLDANFVEPDEYGIAVYLTEAGIAEARRLVATPEGAYYLTHGEMPL